MSASREKQNRQAKAGQSDPKTAREAQQQKEQKRSNILYGAIAVVFLIVVVISVIWRADVIPRMSTAAVIDGKSYNAAEVDYFYQSAYRNFVNNYSYLLSYFGLDTSAPLKSQVIDENAAAMLGIELPASKEAEDDSATGGETNAEGEDDSSAGGETDAESEDTAPAVVMTWHEYFLDQALENMTVIQKALEAASAEGFTYPAGVQAQYDDHMDSLRSNAVASGISVSQYLKGNFGSGMTEKVYGEQLMRVLQYSAYASTYSDDLTFSDSELETVYSGAPTTYDYVSYEVSSISGAAESTVDDEGNTVEPTEEESAAALAAAQEIAQALLDGLNDGGTLEDLVDDYKDATYTFTESGTYSAGSAVSEWLYDDARQEGDYGVVEDGTTEYVLVFHSRGRDESPTIDIRHILVPLGTATLSEGDEGYEEEQAQLKADALAKAEELLAQWQSGEATEDSFAALAMAESTDGSKYDGGLYTEVYQGQMVETFNDWCFDASRKPGDTGVVETQYGAHVMYFSGQNMPVWQSQASSVLRNEAYTEWEAGLTEGVSAELRASGTRFIG